MKLRAISHLGFVSLVCPLLVWAQEVKVEIKSCYVAETTVVDKAEDVVVGMHVVRGITDLVGPSAFPDKMMHDCRVVFTTSKSGLEFTNRCNFVDEDGDKILSVANGASSSFQWRWIAGTGKYKGIRGSGTGINDAAYPKPNPVVAGGCWSGKGSYTINK